MRTLECTLLMKLIFQLLLMMKATCLRTEPAHAKDKILMRLTACLDSLAEHLHPLIEVQPEAVYFKDGEGR